MLGSTEVGVGGSSMRNRAKRREGLLLRFQTSSRERLRHAAQQLAAEASRKQVDEVRQSLTTMQGEAHMLGLPSLSSFIEIVLDELAGRPTPSKLARTQVGLEQLREWLEQPLVENEAAQARLEGGRSRLNSVRMRPSEWASERAALDHAAS